MRAGRLLGQHVIEPRSLEVERLYLNHRDRSHRLSPDSPHAMPTRVIEWSGLGYFARLRRYVAKLGAPRRCRPPFGAVAACVATLIWALPRTGLSNGCPSSPRITVVSSADDSSLPEVQESIDFWNRTFSELRVSLRFGAIHHVVGTVPEADLRALSDASASPWPSAGFLRAAWLRVFPQPFDEFPGDLLIVVSDAHFISFAARIGARRLVAIKNTHIQPLTLPNVLRNVLAHELGHAIGLGHNSDPSMLMCGRPAPCRPDIYMSNTPRFLPLTGAERTHLQRLYQ